MRDPRVERLAELIVGYSLRLRQGQVLRINGEEGALTLAVALYRAGLRAGGLPYLNVAPAGLDEILLTEGTDEQLTFVSEGELMQTEAADAWAMIWTASNTRALTRIPPERRRTYLSTQYRLVNRRWQRLARGELELCGTLFPTQAHAQDAEMSLGDYEDFVYGACHVDGDEDSIAHWESVSATLNARAQQLDCTRELRILGPDTDLRLVVDGRRWIASDGRHNMPDGEVFTSPVETETEGEIYFAFPSIFQGQEVENVRLRFEGGRVVRAEATAGADYLRALIATDEGSRVLGELAFGLNYEIDRFTRDILFDEKIGGTMHVALGGGFEAAGTRNTSDLHWDLICDLREEGEVYADGDLVWRAGSFLTEVTLAGA
ncbi:MAG TPA: aminopeptidase [Gaiellaceae bacterium]|nr:aminopeptidase [Gaiellaceae bacterium]